MKKGRSHERPSSFVLHDRAASLRREDPDAAGRDVEGERPDYGRVAPVRAIAASRVASGDPARIGGQQEAVGLGQVGGGGGQAGIPVIVGGQPDRRRERDGGAGGAEPVAAELSRDRETLEEG